MLSCLCLDASSSSSEEHDEEDGSPAVFAARPVKDWISLDFGIVRDQAASKVCRQPAAVTAFVCMTDDMQSMHRDASLYHAAPLDTAAIAQQSAIALQWLIYLVALTKQST
jgi:hypothetical protein